MVYPQTAPIVADPHPDMPDDVRAYYDEAASVAHISARAAAVLIRVALQALLKHISHPTGKLSFDIANLVKEGYDPDIILAIDLVRLLGDDGAHPDQIMLGQTIEDVNDLFFLLNFITNTKYDKLRALNRVKEMGKAIPPTEQGYIDDRNRGQAPPASTDKSSE